MILKKLSKEDLKTMLPKKLLLAANLFLIAAPLLTPGRQDGVQPSQRLDPKIQKIVSEISADRIAEIEKKLESFGTRNTMSDPTQPDRGVGAARQWIFNQFKSFSPRLQVSFETHTIPKAGRVWKEIELR